ncbi:MAG: hypothetical protein M0Q91_13270 [Methanoregula sp.]|nr:hypothetical protein [Methanoregula sp.]
MTKSTTPTNARPDCPACHSKNVMVRKDRSILCRRCGNDTRESSES